MTTLLAIIGAIVVGAALAIGAAKIMQRFVGEPKPRPRSYTKPNSTSKKG